MLIAYRQYEPLQSPWCTSRIIWPRKYVEFLNRIKTPSVTTYFQANLSAKEAQ